MYFEEANYKMCQNYSKVSDAKDILNNRDNENEVTFVLLVTVTAPILQLQRNAATSSEAEKRSLERSYLPHSLK